MGAFARSAGRRHVHKIDRKRTVEESRDNESEAVMGSGRVDERTVAVKTLEENELKRGSKHQKKVNAKQRRKGSGHPYLAPAQISNKILSTF